MKKIIILAILVSCGGGGSDGGGNNGISGQYYCYDNCVQDECSFPDDMKVTQNDTQITVDVGTTTMIGTYSDGSFDVSYSGTFCSGTIEGGEVYVDCNADGVYCDTVTYKKR